MGTCGFYKALGPSALRLHTEATRAHRKALRTCSVHYGKIFPPQLLSPPYSIQFYYIRSQFRAVNTKLVILNVR